MLATTIRHRGKDFWSSVINRSFASRICWVSFYFDFVLSENPCLVLMLVGQRLTRDVPNFNQLFFHFIMSSGDVRWKEQYQRNDNRGFSKIKYNFEEKYVYLFRVMSGCVLYASFHFLEML